MRFRLLLSGLLALAGCDTLAGPPDLGDAYTVAAEPAPRLDEDRLRLTVSYSGGCEMHTFDLGVRTEAGAAEVWLHHDANGDACEAYLTRELEVALPAEALRAMPLRLVVAEGETVVLRG